MAGTPLSRLALSVVDSLQNRLLASVLSRLDEHDQRFDEIDNRLSRHTRRIRSWEVRMSRLSDFLEQFRSEVNDQTNRISGQLADLQAKLAEGSDAAATEVSDALSPLISQLQAIGSGSSADPLPTPPAGGDTSADGSSGTV